MNRGLVKTTICAAAWLGLSMAAPKAHAVANHQIEQVQKIVKGKKVIGARVHLLVSPEYYSNFRVNVAPQRKLPPSVKSNNTDHRKTLAGAIGKFVIKNLKEVNGAQQNSTSELYVDIIYDGKKLKPGAKVNVLSAYSSEKFGKQMTGGPHIFGAWDGPVNQNDATYIITLPNARSKVPKAADTVVAEAAPKP